MPSVISGMRRGVYWHCKSVGNVYCHAQLVTFTFTFTVAAEFTSIRKTQRGQGMRMTAQCDPRLPDTHLIVFGSIGQTESASFDSVARRHIVDAYVRCTRVDVIRTAACG